jgi:hypothetical protein
MTEVVTDTLVIISETIIVPETFTQTAYEPAPTRGPDQGPVPTQGPDQWPDQWPDQRPAPTRGPDQWPDQGPAPTRGPDQWPDQRPAPTRGPDQWPNQPQGPNQDSQPATWDTLPPEWETTQIPPPEDHPVQTQTATWDSPPNQGTQPAEQDPPIETITTPPPEWGTAPYNPFNSNGSPATGVPPPTGQQPENIPAPTPVQTSPAVPDPEFTPGPDKPTDVEEPPFFDPGLGPTGGPISVIPADMQSPARCGPNQPNCADGYYCDPQPLCAIGQNCPGLCLPKLASIYSQPDNMRGAVWDKAMRDGIYRIALLVTEIRTAIPITTNGKWLTMASNWTGESVASASPLLRNATASGAGGAALTAEAVHPFFGNATSIASKTAGSLLVSLSSSSNVLVADVKSSADTKASSTADLKSSSSAEGKASSAVEVKVSSTVDESKPVSSLVFEGKWLNGTSNSTLVNSTSHL